MHIHPLRRLTGLVLGVSTLLTLVLLAFAWPASELEPRALPAVAAPEPAAAQVEERLAASAGADAFDVTAVADRDAAVAALQDREAYAAVVASPAGPPEVLVATAASPAVAQLFAGTAAELDATVTDVAPPPEADPRGVTFNSGALPLVLGGLLTGILCSAVLGTGRQRLAAAGTIAVVGGTALAWTLQEWLEVIGGDLWRNAGVIALGIAAMAATVIGLRRAFGPAGIGMAAVLIMLVGNPLSGLTSAPELLPFGRLGELMPPGALGSALRSTAYFDGAGAGMPLLVLAGWTVVGAGLALLPTRSAATAEEPEPEVPRVEAR